MKYKLKRDLPWAKAGTLVDADFTRSGNGNISYSFVAQKGEYEGKEIWQGWYPKQYGDWSNWFEEVDERWEPEDIERIISEKEIVCTVNKTTKSVVSLRKLAKFLATFLSKLPAEEIKALLKEFHKNNP